MGSTAGATAQPIDITRFIAEQHALGKTDEQIAADFQALGASVAATDGDPAGRAKIETDLGTIHDANSAVLVAKLGVKTNNGRQGIAPGAAVDAWLRGGTTGTSAAIESAINGAAPAPAPAPTETEHVGVNDADLNVQATNAVAAVEHRGVNDADLNAQATNAVAAVEHRGVNDADLNGQATNAVAAVEHRGINNADLNAQATNAVATKMAADKVLQANLQQDLGVKVEADGLVVRARLDGKTYTWAAQSTQPLPGGGSRAVFLPHTGIILRDGKIYEVTVQPYSVRTPDGKVSSGANITKSHQV